MRPERWWVEHDGDGGLSSTVLIFVRGLGGHGRHRLGNGLARVGTSVGGEAGGQLLDGAPRPQSAIGLRRVSPRAGWPASSIREGTSTEGCRPYMLEICWGSIDGDGSFLATGTGTSDEISPVPTSFFRSTARGTRKELTRCSSQANARRWRAAWGSGSGGRLGRRRHHAVGRSRRPEQRRWEGRRRRSGGSTTE